eukprot:gnl/MRDRNA2_/MRDRNA2_57130_c0_seq1.p1 gnl/MRDRNA2_/MRDRNA2_57130_c0~~gnl/MRDRNA2_/MRDRNA2_57130_c0_seq1.p1  ORF type:complete len:256 (+),score=26.07 gnl/MRDRNA2_/MRDRNA2_57130_c0_seq1:102-869(+)
MMMCMRRMTLWTRFMFVAVFALSFLAHLSVGKRAIQVDSRKGQRVLDSNTSESQNDGADFTPADNEGLFACCCIVPGTQFATKVKALNGWKGFNMAGVYADKSRKHLIRRIEYHSILEIPLTSPQPWFKQGGHETSDTWFQVSDGWVSFHPAHEKVDYYESVGGPAHTYLTYDIYSKRFEVVESDITKQSRCWAGQKFYGGLTTTQQCKMDANDESVYMARVISGTSEKASCESTFNGKSKEKFTALLKHLLPST